MAVTNGTLHAPARDEAERQVTLRIVPTCGRFALANDALTFVMSGPPILGSTQDHSLQLHRNGYRYD